MAADDSFDMDRAFMNDTSRNTNTNKRRIVIRDISNTHGASKKARTVTNNPYRKVQADQPAPDFPSSPIEYQDLNPEPSSGAGDEALRSAVAHVLHDHCGEATGAFFENNFNKIMKSIRDPLAKKLDTIVVNNSKEVLKQVNSGLGGVNDGTNEVLGRMEEITNGLQTTLQEIQRLKSEQRQFACKVADVLKTILERLEGMEK